jgi:hypothetical protein
VRRAWRRRGAFCASLAQRTGPAVARGLGAPAAALPVRHGIGVNPCYPAQCSACVVWALPHHSPIVAEASHAPACFFGYPFCCVLPPFTFCLPHTGPLRQSLLYRASPPPDSTGRIPCLSARGTRQRLARRRRNTGFGQTMEGGVGRVGRKRRVKGRAACLASCADGAWACVALRHPWWALAHTSQRGKRTHHHPGVRGCRAPPFLKVAAREWVGCRRGARPANPARKRSAPGARRLTAAALDLTGGRTVTDGPVPLSC